MKATPATRSTSELWTVNTHVSAAAEHALSYTELEAPLTPAFARSLCHSLRRQYGPSATIRRTTTETWVWAAQPKEEDQ